MVDIHAAVFVSAFLKMTSLSC